MSKIEYCFKNTNILYVDYKKISRVCSKIGFDDSKITWFIFNPDERKSNSIIGNIRIGYSGEEYGFCYIAKKEIWISTLSIMRDNDALPFSKIRDQLKLSQLKERDFLADVIIDEITHIQTGYGHGSHKYDMKYRENVENYYISPIDRAMLKR